MNHLRLLACVSLVFPALCFAQERSLGHAALNDVQIQLRQLKSDALALDAGPAAGIALATPGFSDGKGLRDDQPLTTEAIQLPGGAQAMWVRFGLDDGAGGVRAVAVLLSRATSSAAWTVSREWSADSGALGELGFKRESQKFLADAAGTITRKFKNLRVEGVLHKLDCGCSACQSRTTDIEESDVIRWNPATRAFDTVQHEKWYVAQTGENLMVAVRKALGDARLINRVARLNPDIKDAATFSGGERVLVQRDITGGKN